MSNWTRPLIFTCITDIGSFADFFAGKRGKVNANNSWILSITFFALRRTVVVIVGTIYFATSNVTVSIMFADGTVSV